MILHRGLLVVAQLRFVHTSAICCARRTLRRVPSVDLPSINSKQVAAERQTADRADSTTLRDTANQIGSEPANLASVDDVDQTKQVPSVGAARSARRGRSSLSSTVGTPKRHSLPTRSKYLGVIRDGKDTKLWEAVVVVDGREISGGEYDTQEEAARAYDALVRMYLGESSHTNFPSDPYTSWVPPDAVATTGQIPTLPGQRLTVEEIVAALNQERGIDVQVVDLAGKSSIAQFLIFVTGKSVPHMRKMADMVSRALRKRRLKGVDASVEGREMDDWMVVDCDNIIVNVMDAEAREVFDLERFYNNMKLGEDPYAGQTYEEWLAANPIPEKWLARLERDEVELASMSVKSRK